MTEDYCILISIFLQHGMIEVSKSEKEAVFGTFDSSFISWKERFNLQDGMLCFKPKFPDPIENKALFLFIDVEDINELNIEYIRRYLMKQSYIYDFELNFSVINKMIHSAMSLKSNLYDPLIYNI